MAALPYALPAAAAGLVYLNGRYGCTYDWALISSYVRGTAAAAIHEKRDDLNLFYHLERHAQSSRGDHPWIIHNGQSWTYAQAYQIVLQFGTWFKSKGVQKNEIVAMDFVNSDTFIWVWFGLWSIGAKPAFINYNLAGKPLMHTIRTSTARLILVDEDGRDKFSEEVMAEHGFVPKASRAGLFKERQAAYDFDSKPVPGSFQAQKAQKGDPSASAPETTGMSPAPERRRLEIVFFNKQLENHIRSLEPIRPPDSERNGQKRTDMALLIYTSGTTGLPKPAVMSWGKASSGSTYVANWVPYHKNSILYTSMPLYHSSAAIFGVCAILQAGSTLCLGKKFSHKTFWPEVRASKATVIQYVGETCRYLLAAPESPLDKDHCVHTAFGNGLRPDVWEPFKSRFEIPTICEFYAATEAPSAMWNRSTNSFSAGAIARNGSLATLLMRNTLALVRMDPDSEPPEPLRDPQTGLCQLTDKNESGEILYTLDAANISTKFQGYFGNSKATASKVIRDVKKKGDAYFRSGDLVRCDAEGRWWFMDRIGDTFRWKAENVSTAEVSEVLGKHEVIEEANVYGVSVPRHDGRAGCAAIVLKGGDKQTTGNAVTLPPSQTLKSLADHLTKGLPAFALPIWLRVTRSMQTTGTNKQQKHLLQQDGIDVSRVEQSGDVLFWLRDGTYVRFTEQDLHRIKGGGVKL
ncbi:hypothetical protein BDV95DRAFT_558013 [Massariosphaeria phaeospora]|uniref:Long-chain fatty acid transporter-like protein n=1 Tax=Massariosphaeria phaeospora TaxID=100035 RepID=A0A7C8IGX4_9PLEO|nr:hypothetical protein BDV95DRAFT_558013 [Massariosphaeria phaeospora]